MGYDVSKGLFDTELVEGWYKDQMDDDFEERSFADTNDEFNDWFEKSSWLEVVEDDWLDFEAGERHPEMDCA